MLIDNWRHKHMQYACRGLLLFAAVFFVLPVFADATIDVGSTSIDVSSISAETMLVNLSTQLPSLMRMVTAIGYVMGMYFIIYGVMKLKQYGESRTQMSTEHTLRGPLVFITIGTLLLYFPTTVEVGMSTFWSAPNPYGYIQDTDQWSQFVNVCFTIVQFVGVVSFIRGLVILNQLSSHGGHQGAFGKGITHIIGGIFCVNIYQFVQTIFGTLLGIQIS